MKPLMITNYFESHQGGLELIGGRLVRELVRLGEDVRWVASDVTPPPQDDELRLRAVPVRLCNVTERRLGIPFPFPGLSAIRTVAREVRRADAVLLQDLLYPMCIVAFLCAALWHKPVVIAQHVGIVPYRNPIFRLIMTFLNRVVARPMLARADRVRVLQRDHRALFCRGSPSGPSEVDVHRRGHRNFSSLGRRRGKSALRRRLGLSPERPVALFVGRFVEKKGLPILAHMVRQRPEIQWVFAGWGHLDPEAWGAPNVSVFRGRSGADLAPLYQSERCFRAAEQGRGLPAGDPGGACLRFAGRVQRRDGRGGSGGNASAFSGRGRRVRNPVTLHPRSAPRSIAGCPTAPAQRRRGNASISCSGAIPGRPAVPNIAN